MLSTYSVKDTRDKLADLINMVDIAGASFVITKFGKPKAILAPYREVIDTKKNGLKSSFGAWSGRKDIKDSNIWVSNLRNKMSQRE